MYICRRIYIIRGWGFVWFLDGSGGFVLLQAYEKKLRALNISH